MSDHSDLVARLRNIDKESVFSIPYLCTAVADALDALLDVKPGANADLIAEARRAYNMIKGLEVYEDSLEPETLIARLADALESADSRARVLPTRDELAAAICVKVDCSSVCGPFTGKDCEFAADAVLALLTGGKADVPSDVEQPEPTSGYGGTNIASADGGNKPTMMPRLSSNTRMPDRG